MATLSLVRLIKISTAMAVLGTAGTVAAWGQSTPPAPAIAPNFTIIPSGAAPLDGRCAPSFVAPRMAAVLGAFNSGRATRLAGYFVATAAFEPYNGRPAGSYRARGRAEIASVVSRRHRAGDGWTAFELVTPKTAIGEGIFGLSLRARADGVAFEQGVKVVISCNTGQIRKWRGPAWAG